MLVMKVHPYVSLLAKVSDVPLYMLSHQERLMGRAEQGILMEPMEEENLLKTQTGRCGATPKS